MRFIIYMLILANVAFYAWHVYSPTPTPQTAYQPPTVPAGAKRLVLLKERGQLGDQAASGSSQPKVPVSGADEVPATTPPPSQPTKASSSDAERQAAPPSDRDTPGTMPTPAKDDKAPQTPSAQSASQPTPAAPAPPAGRSPPASPVQESGPTTSSTAGPAPQAAASCYRVGPLTDAVAAAALSTRLAEQGLNAQVQNTQVNQPDGYWVFLPPMSHDEAVGISEDLSSKGITDYFIGKDNYISLGIFNGPQSAEQRRQQIAAMGYAPKVEQHFTTQQQYWLAVRVEAGTAVSDQDWENLLSAAPGVRRTASDCE
ncbi:MAG: hypothetical protein WCC36_04950 [Gammaproteobacteria bacterium]